MIGNDGRDVPLNEVVLNGPKIAPDEIGGYRFVRTLGKGSVGIVMLGVHAKTGQKVKHLCRFFLHPTLTHIRWRSK